MHELLLPGLEGFFYYPTLYEADHSECAWAAFSPLCALSEPDFVYTAPYSLV